MQKSTYWQKLQDPRWQKKRLEILNRDGFKCRVCGCEQRQLQVHHGYYISKRDPWNYPDSSLKTLCSVCHEQETLIVNEGFCKWEHLFGLNEEIGDSLYDSILHGSCRLEIQPVVLLKLLVNALHEGAVDHETILLWKESLATVSKEIAELEIRGGV